MKRISIMMILAVVFSANIFSQDYELRQAKRLIENGEYKDAALQLRPLAESGNAEAQYLAASLFFEGKGVMQSDEQGVNYATMAAGQGNTDAMKLLCLHYREKEDSVNLYNYSSKYCTSYPELLKSEVGFLLALCYVYGYGTEKNEMKGYDILEKNEFGKNYLTTNGAEDYWNYYMVHENCSTLEECVDSLIQKTEYIKKALSLVDYIIATKFETTEIALNEYLRQATEEKNPYAMACVAYLTSKTDSENRFSQIKSWAKKAADANSEFGKYFWEQHAKFYRIVGERYTEGTIFWVDYTGRNALIAKAPQKATYANSRDIAEGCKDAGLVWRCPSKEECYELIRQTNYSPIGEWWFYKYGCINAKSQYHLSFLKHNLYSYKGCVSIIADVTPGNVRFPRKGQNSSNNVYIDRIIVENGLTHVFVMYENRTGNSVPVYSFDPNTYLKSGKYTHKLLKQSYSTESSILYPDSHVQIQLTFAGIPPNWDILDVIESKHDGCFFRGVTDL